MRDYWTEMTDAELEIENRLKTRWWEWIEGVLGVITMTALLVLPIFV
jgi:uncharacterized membrane protein YdcZ (DUF606 family)